MMKCSLNQNELNVRRYLAMMAPRGSRKRKPMTIRIACATMCFSYVSSGGEDVATAGADGGPPGDAASAIVNMGFVGSFELEVSVLVKSSFVGPELRC